MTRRRLFALLCAMAPWLLVCAQPELDYVGDGHKKHSLQVCEGDCDDDTDCDYGLACFQRRRTETVEGCLGEGESGKDYCYKPKLPTLVLQNDQNKPFQECEGDCETDDDCESGLLCWDRDDDEDIPGCLGEGLPYRNYCYQAPHTLVTVGDRKTNPELYPIGRCEGDCDSDKQCKLGLSCFSRKGTEKVPGCLGSGDDSLDYCYKPDPADNVLVRDVHNEEPQSAFPLGHCRGECKRNRDCQSGLECFLRTEDEPVPGCSGDGIKGLGYCVYKEEEPAESTQQNPTEPTEEQTSSTPGGSLPTKNYKKLRHTESCSPESPCGKCQGDCYNDDSNCGQGLVCFSRLNTEHYVPGCVNAGPGSVEGASYCYRPPSGPETYVRGDTTVSMEGLLLSTGLSARVVATERERVPYIDGGESEERFHKNPDGAAVFADTETGGWIYVTNAESRNYGGVGAITFNSDGEVTDYKMVAQGTVRNCGGGKTPWNTWLTCEEIEGGQVWEVDPWGKREARETLMGGEGNMYESAAYDNRNPNRPKFYITTDVSDGPIVRYTPDKGDVKTAISNNDYSDLLHSNTTGTAKIHYLVMNPSENDKGRGTFTWSPKLSDGQKSALMHHENCEGIDFRKGMLYVTCKEFQHLFIFDIDNNTYQRSSTRGGAFDGSPDQVARVVGQNDAMLYFCEEGGDVSGIHARDPKGNYYTIVEAIGDDFNGETTGLAFSPDNMHMYVSYQEAGKIFDITRDDGYPFGAKKLDIKYHTSPVTKEK